MKKLLLSVLMIACVAISANAQKTAKKKSPIANIESISFYGVDFSQGKVYGATDEADKLKKAFEEINGLFVSQPAKYNVAELTGKKVNRTNVKAVSTSNSNIPAGNVKTTNSNFTISNQNITAALKNLKIDAGDSGTGFVVVTQQLNKTSGVGTYYMVFFDIKTRNIVSSFKLTGVAAGSGLRDYWAASVYDAMKKIKKYKQ
ncbi:MAG: hypothetical protein IKZ99_06095 [Salinivirgaceae bacterium]|nr:hypothetical protein [Salinivirgaceae bacterium]